MNFGAIAILAGATLVAVLAAASKDNAPGTILDRSAERLRREREAQMQQDLLAAGSVRALRPSERVSVRAASWSTR